ATFYAAWGWTTSLWGFQVSAWLGRVAAWIAFAVAWYGLVRALRPGFGHALLSAALLLVLLRWGHLSGEWLIGGVEAKAFAYPMAIVGWTRLVEGRWARVWPWLGAASAFHVLVGGWSVLAAAMAWSLESATRRPPLVRM